MDITVVIMLAVGALTAAAGFILPQKKTRQTDVKQEEEKIREFLEHRMDEAKGQIADVVDESLQYAVEKTERALDRLTNEKMTAVHEYSDSVLKEIHKNHEEVMFLYDMLNDKQVNLKNTVKEVTKSAKEAEEKAMDAKLTAEQARENIKRAPENTLHVPEDVLPVPAESVPRTPEGLTESGQQDNRQTVEAETGTAAERKSAAKAPKAAALEAGTESGARKTGGRRRTAQSAAAENGAAEPGARSKQTSAAQVQIQFAPESGTVQNNNVRILEMHKMGKSNMAIARELGLGLGEVKLVIDLFEGI